MIDYLLKLDTQIFLELNSLHNSFFDFVMYYISEFWTWIPLFIFAIFLFVKKLKKLGIFALLFLIFAIGISDFLSVKLFKEVFERLRPCHNEQIKDLVHIVNGHCGGKFGFISSHSANFFALATFSSLIIKNKTFTFLIFSIAVLVAYSRIYLGVHYPLDIICGGIFGAIISLIFYFLYKTIFIKTKTNN